MSKKAKPELPYQPISEIQLSQLKIEWVERDTIKPNNYNPNKMTFQDRQLLKTSLLEDGWTQPIVTLPDHTIVDGEQRWTTSGIELHPEDIDEIIAKMEARKAAGHPESDSILARLRDSRDRLAYAIEHGAPPCLASITNGLVPITKLDLGDDAHKIISTIRHNRARGTHQIDAMAGLTKDLEQLGLDIDDLENRLGMDEEEIDRMLHAAEGQIAAMQAELEAQPFSPVTEMVHIAELAPEAQPLAAQSAQLNQRFKDYQVQVANRDRQIAEQKEQALQAVGKTLTQEEKDALEKQIADEIPAPVKPTRPELKKLVFLVTPEEYDIVTSALGANAATALVELCRAKVVA